jgi:hypothetical protein
MQIKVPAYKFTTKSAAIESIKSVNERFGFTFNVSGYDERVIVKQGRYYYVPKDEYTYVIGESKEESYFVVEVPEIQANDNSEQNSQLVGE